MKVYVVAPGEYSDYHIKAIFSTRKKAQDFIAEFRRLTTDRYNGFYELSDEAIEEWVVDEHTERPMGCWHAYIEEDGTLYWKDWDLNGDPHAPAEAHKGYQSGAGPVPRRFSGHGKTLEHARRSAEELRRQRVALGKQ